MKRIITAMMALIMMASIMCGSVSHAETFYNANCTVPTKQTENISASKEGNSFLQPVDQKTEVPEGYIGIYTAEDMDNIRNNLSGRYILMADIDLAPLGNWDPIGKCEESLKDTYDEHMNIIGTKTEYVGKEAFCGTFDGNGHVLSGITINKEYDSVDISIHSVGIFAAAENCKISNLGVIDTHITAHGGAILYAASIVGRQFENVCIENCFSSADITAGCNGYTVAAGIAGESTTRNSGIIRNCINYGAIKCELKNDTVDLNVSLPYPYNIGSPSLSSAGIGFAQIVENSINYGDVVTEISGKHKELSFINACGIGGLEMITGCTNYGCIRTYASNCCVDGSYPNSSTCFTSGGIAFAYISSIKECRNYGDVVSQVDKTSSIPNCLLHVGGIIGDAEYTVLSDCMNEGAISAYSEIKADAYAGGIAALLHIYNYNGRIQSSCNSGSVSAITVDSNAYAGGVVAQATIEFLEIRQLNLSNMFNTGKVTADGNKYSICGGVFGYIGFMGMDTASKLTITSIYNSGEIYCSAEDNMGAIAGMSTNPYVVVDGNTMPQAAFLIKNAYFSESCENAIGNARGDIVQNYSIVQLSNEQMLNKTSYIGFNFIDIWEMDSEINGGLPALRVFTGNVSDIELGDVNRNGRIDIGDAVLILRHYTGLITLEEAETALGDANCDFVLDVSDAVTILRHVAGLD